MTDMAIQFENIKRMGIQKTDKDDGRPKYTILIDDGNSEEKWTAWDCLNWEKLDAYINHRTYYAVTSFVIEDDTIKVGVDGTCEADANNLGARELVFKDINLAYRLEY